MPFSIYNEVDRFTIEHLSTTIETLGLPRLARSLLTLIGSCRIYSIFQIKAAIFRTRCRSCNRFAKETICSSSLALTKNSVINKTQTQNGAQTLYFNLLQKVLSLWNYFILMSCYTLRSPVVICIWLMPLFVFS